MNSPVASPAPPPPAPTAGGGRPTPPTNPLAIISLVSGILGWSVLPMVASIVAIITGHLARSEIRRSPGAVEGDGLALVGLILGYAMIAVTLLTVILAVLFFGGLAVWLAIASAWG